MAETDDKHGGGDFARAGEAEVEAESEGAKSVTNLRMETKSHRTAGGTSKALSISAHFT